MVHSYGCLWLASAVNIIMYFYNHSPWRKLHPWENISGAVGLIADPVFLRNNGDGVALKLCDFGFYKQTAIPSCCPVSSLAFGTTFTGGKISWEEPGCGLLSKVPLDVADVNYANKRCGPVLAGCMACFVT